MDEDVDAIGISSLATDHVLVPKLMDEIRAQKMDDVVIVGGIVPDPDVRLLEDAGVDAVFHPGIKRDDIVSTITAKISETRVSA